MHARFISERSLVERTEYSLASCINDCERNENCTAVEFNISSAVCLSLLKTYEYQVAESHDTIIYYMTCEGMQSYLRICPADFVSINSSTQYFPLQN